MLYLCFQGEMSLLVVTVTLLKKVRQCLRQSQEIG